MSQSVASARPELAAPTPAAPEIGKPFPWLGLMSLASAVFLSVTSEMLPTGLLPDMSRSLAVQPSQIGLLVSVFAFTVVLTSTGLTMLTKRVQRRRLVLWVLVVFAISNAFTAIAPSYELVVASRILGGLAHGLFWAVVGAYAAHLVPKELIGRAVSLVIGGGTLAFVFGVPVGTALGHAIGWRLSFAALAVITLGVTVLVWRFLPPVAAVHSPSSTAQNTVTDVSDPAAPSPRRSRRDPTVVAVALVCVVCAIVMIGHYSFYTYVAPFIIHMGAGEYVAPLLFVFGIAGAVGLFLAGSVLGKKPRLSIVIVIATVALFATLLGVLAQLLPLAIAAFTLWGVAFGALPSLLQTRLLHVASARIRDTASAFYTTGFNIGIGGGALLGSVLFDTVGVAALPFIYVGILMVGLALFIGGERLLNHRR